MNMTFETPRRLRIELNKADLVQLDITYDQIDYRDSHTREVLSDLLGRVGAKDTFGSRADRTLIEVYPTDGGGCVIYFTALQMGEDERPPRMRKLILEPTVFRIGTAGDVLSALAALKAAGARPVRCELYQSDDGYRLVSVCSSADKTSEPILYEYGTVVGRGSIYSSATAEHGKLISADALGEIGRFLN